MTIKIKTLALLMFMASVHFALGQDNKQKALEKGKQAITLEDDGKVDEAITLLKEAQKLDPNNVDYPYELGYAYYLKSDYKQASKYLEGILKHKDINNRVYQLLGNCYDNLGKPDKAIETYEAGLKKFPNSGNLYLELGTMQMGKKEYNKAIYYYENGIKMDPTFPSNYYWASKLYCSSTEEVWGMIYGEIFMNLERNSKRTSEISKLLYNTYRSEIKFTSDTSYTVSFCKQATINISLDDLKDTAKLKAKIKLPFGTMVYEPTLLLSITNEKSIDINSLDRIRKKFVDLYFNNGNDKKYPNILFDYQKKVMDAGHLEAYNHWILMKGNEDDFEKWYSDNKDKWESFIKWFSNNAIQIDKDHRFYREQY